MKSGDSIRLTFGGRQYEGKVTALPDLDGVMDEHGGHPTRYVIDLEEQFGVAPTTYSTHHDPRCEAMDSRTRDRVVRCQLWRGHDGSHSGANGTWEEAFHVCGAQRELPETILRCIFREGHDGAHRHLTGLGPIDWSLPMPPRAPSGQCESIEPTHGYPIRCAFPAGHIGPHQNKGTMWDDTVRWTAPWWPKRDERFARMLDDVTACHARWVAEQREAAASARLCKRPHSSPGGSCTRPLGHGGPHMSTIEWGP